MNKKITEQESNYRHLDRMDTTEILNAINHEDSTVPTIVKNSIATISKLINEIKEKLLNGGRLFYIGAGTSGRLGVLDASECPPTYGVSKDLVIGIIAGGDEALRYGQENIEDDEQAGLLDLQSYNLSNKDVVVGIAASGTTPYVIGALKYANEIGASTGCIVCNSNTPIARLATFAIELIVGPEFVTGSTRMKCGTAQKLVLNMISTTVMIGLGLVEDNRMVNMQISNEKLINRGVMMLMDGSHIKDYNHAKEILLKYGSVKLAIQHLKNNS